MSKIRTSARRLTLKDVARSSGFSPSTVSIVLNGAPLSRYVAAATKAKILDTARRLGYRPNHLARSFRSQRSHMIGVLVIDLADPYGTLILQGIEGKLLQTNYLPIMMDAQNQAQQVERYIERMMERQVEALIVVAGWLRFDISLVADISGRRIPTVAVGRDLESPLINSVVADNEAGGYAAMEHLYRLGHRDIVFLRGPRRGADSQWRWKGIRRYANEVGLRLNPALIQGLADLRDSRSSFEDGRRLTRKLITSGQKFTAILAYDDITAYGAIRALSEGGRRVPEDCSVIGFDDLPTAAISTPGLSTIRQPLLEMGEYAAAYILKGLGQPEGNQDQSFGERHLIATQLIVRQSTASRSGGRRKSR